MQPARRIVAAIVVWGLLTAATPAAALASPLVRAELEGEPIAIGEVSTWFCHDLAFPTITCFRDAGALERSVAGSSAAGSVYVTLYSDSGYTGSYVHLSEDYDGLWTIGWNDHASSFIAKNGERGEFYTDWYAGGQRYGFCCDAQVSYLGGFDNTFSSAYRT